MVTPRQILERVHNALAAGDEKRAWQLARQLRQHVGSEPRLAQLWLRLLSVTNNQQRLINEARFLMGAWEHDGQLVTAVLQRLAEVSAQWPSDEPERVKPLDQYLAETGARVFEQLQQRDDTDSRAYCFALALNVAKALGRLGTEHRQGAVDMLDSAEQLAPDDDRRAAVWSYRALVHQWWGEWQLGKEAGLRAAELGANDRTTLSNLAVCATACSDAEAGIKAWQAMGFAAQVGDDGAPYLPGLDPVYVRLRLDSAGVQTALEHPPTFETVRVQPRSPAHGPVRVPTVFDGQADYGDLLLWNPGAAIGSNQGSKQTPRFALLSVLQRSEYPIYRFVAQQRQPGQVAGLSEGVPGLELCLFDEQAPFIPRLLAGPKNARTQPPAPGTVQGKLVVTEPAGLAGIYEALTGRLEQLAPDVAFAAPELARALNRDVTDTEAIWRRIVDGNGEAFRQVTPTTPVTT